MRLRTICLGFTIGVAAASSGCSVWDKNTNAKKPNDSWSIKKLWKKEYPVPQSLAAIWSPDVLTIGGQPPTRGFGGRVFFYNPKSQAIPVEGELIVHGYRRPPFAGESEAVAADKTFAFTAEQLTEHFSPSELGASYSIWIPWDAADGFREEVTLIPTFKGTDGTILQGAAAKLYLPGKSTELGAKPSAQVQSVSYEQRSTPTNPGIELPRATRGMRTTTIEVPPSATLTRKRPSSRELEAYVLGAAAGIQEAQQGISVGGQKAGGQAPGVSVGGATKNPNANQPGSPTVEKTSPGMPSEVGLPTLPKNLEILPPQRNQRRFSAPIADRTWGNQAGLLGH